MPHIDGEGIWIVKNRAINAGTHIFNAFAKPRLEGKIAISDRAVKTLPILVVASIVDAVVPRRIVGKCRKKYGLLAISIQARSRKQHFQAVIELLAKAHASELCVKASTAQRNLTSLKLPTFFGNDVDDAEKGAGAIQRGSGTANNFYSIDKIDIERKIAAGGSLLVDAVVNA